MKYDGMLDVIQALEAELVPLRDALANKQRQLKVAKDLLAELRGGVVSIPSENTNTPVSIADPPRRGRGRPPGPQKTPRFYGYSRHNIQTALVDFAVKRKDEFTTDEAVQAVLKAGLAPRTPAPR